MGGRQFHGSCPHAELGVPPCFVSFYLRRLAFIKALRFDPLASIPKVGAPVQGPHFISVTPVGEGAYLAWLFCVKRELQGGEAGSGPVRVS